MVLDTGEPASSAYAGNFCNQAITLKTPRVPRTSLSSLPEPLDFAVSKFTVLGFPEQLGFLMLWKPGFQQSIRRNRGRSGHVGLPRP